MTTLYVMLIAAFVLAVYAVLMSLPPYRTHKRKSLLPEEEIGVYEYVRRLAEDAGLLALPSYTFGSLAEPDGRLGCGERRAQFKKYQDKRIHFLIADRMLHVKLLLVLVPEDPTAEERAELDEFAGVVKSQTDYALMYISDTPKDFKALKDKLKELK